VNRCALCVACIASFAMLCPDGYGYVKEMIGESMQGWSRRLLLVFNATNRDSKQASIFICQI